MLTFHSGIPLVFLSDSKQVPHRPPSLSHLSTSSLVLMTATTAADKSAYSLFDSSADSVIRTVYPNSYKASITLPAQMCSPSASPARYHRK